MEQLAKLRAQACVDALVARGVPARRLSASGTGRGGAVNPTFIASAAGAAAGAARASSLLRGQDLGGARAARSDVLRLGNTDGGATQYLAVYKPTSNSVWFTQPDALYVGEKFVLEVLYSPALAIDAPPLEFVMPPHDAELRLELSRPVGNVSIQLVSQTLGTSNWDARLPLPPDCAFRVRHRTVG